MKSVALGLMLGVAAMVAALSSAPSLAQTPPTPMSGSMMQGMPAEMMQMMQRMHSGAMSRMALMGGQPA